MNHSAVVLHPRDALASVHNSTTQILHSQNNMACRLAPPRGWSTELDAPNRACPPRAINRFPNHYVIDFCVPDVPLCIRAPPASHSETFIVKYTPELNVCCSFALFPCAMPHTNESITCPSHIASERSFRVSRVRRCCPKIRLANCATGSLDRHRLQSAIALLWRQHADALLIVTI